MSLENRSVTLCPELSDWIATLYRQSFELPRTDFKQWCFSHLLTILPFDSGLWWSRSDLLNKENLYWAEDTCLYNQPLAFMQNYADIAARLNNPDPLNLYLSTHIGVFYSIWDVCPKAQWYEKDYYQEHCLPYGIENAISALTSPSRYSDVTHIFSFYRAKREHEFSDNEKLTLASLLPHLLEAFSSNLLASFNTQSHATVRGVIDRYGEIILAEEGFISFIAGKGLLQQNKLCIEEIQSLIKAVTVQLKDVTLELSFHEGLIYVEIFEPSLVSQLSKRQKEVCQLITKGFSNKEIAKHLGLKVNTVNNHVQKALRVLKVHSRAAATSYLVRQEILS